MNTLYPARQIYNVKTTYRISAAITYDQSKTHVKMMRGKNDKKENISARNVIVMFLFFPRNNIIDYIKKSMTTTCVYFASIKILNHFLNDTFF